MGPFFTFRRLDAAQWAVRTIRHLAIGDDLVTDDAVGERIRIEGRVLDGSGTPVPDAMVEIWQADGAGRYPGATPAPCRTPRSRASAAARCDRSGAYRFTTVKPGSVRPGRPMQAPHVDVGIFARGLLKRLFTRIYFEGEAGNATDPVSTLVPAERRATLIAAAAGAELTLDVRLQGDKETVFFEA